MKFGCQCGEILADRGDGTSFKAHLRPDEDDDEYGDTIAEEVVRIARQFREASVEDAERVLKSAVQEMGMVGLVFERAIYECARCGRLHVVTPGRDEFSVYTPETKMRRVLASNQNRHDKLG